jgi:prophage regulatory protein
MTEHTENNTPHTPRTRGERILRLAGVMDRTGLSRSSVYRQLGSLRISLGENSAGWLERDIDSWISERIAKRDGSGQAAA